MKDNLCELWYILRHPSDGYTTVKQKKTGSIGISFACAIVWFLATLIKQQYTAFRFSTNNILEINVFYVILGTIVIFLCFTVANWAVCTLFDGEGSFREIFIITGYSLLPYSFSLVCATFLSGLLDISEEIYISIILAFGFLYTVYMLLVGMMKIHDYSFKAVLLSIVATLVGTLLILFMGFLVVTLFAQLYSFIKSIINECLTRGLT